MKCRNCNKRIIKFFSIGKLPPGNGFLKGEEISLERKYDLSVGFCPNCYLVQLIKIIHSKTLYRKSFYLQSSFESRIMECEERARYLTKRLKLSSKNLVLEIGSNNGCQLQFFKKLGMQILGIELAQNAAEIADRKGVLTITEFFDHKLAQKLKNENIKADLILGINLLNHISEIKNFLQGVKLLLKPRGTAFFEFYIQREPDIINHEHVFYFSFLSLRNVFRNANLEMYDAEVKNGVMRIFVSYPDVFPVAKRIENFISEEINKKFNKLQTYQKFAKTIRKTKRELTTLLKKLKNQGKRIAAYSAPEKGNILLNYCRIGGNYLDFIVDKSKLKQGLYTPGAHLLIYQPEKIYQDKPDYILILCWNIADEIIEQLKDYHNAGGKFIVPLPKIKII